MESISKYQDDETLLRQLKNADEDFIKQVYTDMRDDFLKFIISQYHVDLSKASDVYPESFSILYHNIKDGKLKTPLRSSLKTYLFSVGKNIFLKRNHGKFQKKVELRSELPEEQSEMTTLDYYEYSQQKYLVKELLSKIGEACSTLLTMIYLKEQKADEICNELGISSAGTLRKRKFDCLKKMRKLLSLHPNYAKLWKQ